MLLKTFNARKVASKINALSDKEFNMASYHSSNLHISLQEYLSVDREWFK